MACFASQALIVARRGRALSPFRSGLVCGGETGLSDDRQLLAAWRAMVLAFQKNKRNGFSLKALGIWG